MPFVSLQETKESLSKTSKLLNSDRIDLTDEITFSYFLCFSVQVRTNQFVYKPLEKYTEKQQKIHDKIKSMNDSGMSYRRITKYLNENNIPTHTGKKWGVTGNSVYSVLKRYRERLDTIEYQNRDYEPKWSEMRLIKE